MYQLRALIYLARIPGSARRLDLAKRELHELKGQKLRACTCAVGPVDNLHVVQKIFHEMFCAVGEGGN